MENQNYIPEKDLSNVPDAVPIDILENIIEQSKKTICKIRCKEGGNGTGFFCIIPFPDKLHPLPVLMTNHHIIPKAEIIKGNTINCSINNGKINLEIEFDDYRRVYSNEIFDITIIEIKKNENLDFESFLEIDDKIFKGNPNDNFKGNSIYLIGHPKGGKLTYSMGLIKDINEDNYDIRHLCKSDPGSSGCPIINLNNNKVIGIHKGAAKNNQNWNLGTFLKGPLELFKKEKLNYQINNKINYNLNNNIKEVNKEQGNLNKNITKIYKEENNLDGQINIIYDMNKKHNKISNELIKKVKEKWGETISENKIFGETFVNNNKELCKIVINGNEKDLCPYLDKEDLDLMNKKLEIKLKGINNITNSSFMFSGCISIISLPDISNWDTKNVTNMKNMFFLCYSLENISDISKWNTDKVIDMSYMFYQCISLTNLPKISNWNTSNVENMNSMFYQCISLTNLPNISKWNTSNVKNMNSMFYQCISLTNLSDISKWNTKNAINQEDMFYCTNFNKGKIKRLYEKDFYKISENKNKTFKLESMY